MLQLAWVGYLMWIVYLLYSWCFSLCCFSILLFLWYCWLGVALAFYLIGGLLAFACGMFSSGVMIGVFLCCL